MGIVNKSIVRKKMQEEEKFNPKKKENESWKDYLARIEAYMKKSGITQEHRTRLSSLTDSIIKEIHKEN